MEALKLSYSHLSYSHHLPKLTRGVSIRSATNHYATDLSDEPWAILEPLLPEQKWHPGGPGRPPCDVRQVINARACLQSSSDAAFRKSRIEEWRGSMVSLQTRPSFYVNKYSSEEEVSGLKQKRPSLQELSVDFDADRRIGPS